MTFLLTLPESYLMTQRILNDTQAAMWFGITKELLYAYIRNAPKKHLGHDRKLISVVQDGKNYFELNELQNFDNYLREPWSAEGDKRPDIPKYIDEYLKTEIGGNCPITGKGAPLDNAHIEDYAVSRSHHHHNLIRIAKDEHYKADTGIISKDILRVHKQRLVDSLRKKLSLEDGLFPQSSAPPRPHELFIGRNRDLSILTALMETERMIIIQGIGGIGKTQLLLNALRSVRYHNPVIYIDADGVTELKDLKIIIQNGVSEATNNPLGKTLINDLKALTITIILDSLERLLISQRDEVEDFLTNLMLKTESLQLIITTQVDLKLFDHQQHTLQLSGIDDASALSIIKSLLPGTLPLSGDEINWILEFCNGHPLSIKLLAMLIQFYGAAAPAIQKLQDRETLEKPLRRQHNKGTSLGLCLSTAYECMSEEQRRLLFYVRCYPNGLKVKRIPPISGISDLSQNIAEIKQFFFLESRVDILGFERISVPNPVRPFLANVAGLQKEQTKKIELEAWENIAVEAAIIDAYYIESGTHGPQSFGIQRIEDELPNIMEAFHGAQKAFDAGVPRGDALIENYGHVVTGIATGLGKFCFTRGYFEYGLMVSKAAIKINLWFKDFNIAATQYMYLAQLQDRQYDFDGLLKTVEEMEALADSSKDIDMTINANWARGRFLLENRKWDEARQKLEAALRLTLEQEEVILDMGSTIMQDFSKAIRPGNIALLHSELAKVYEFSGNLEKAIEFHQDAISAQVKINDETNLLSSYHHLGYCLIHSGRTDDGLEYLFKSIEGFYRNGQIEYLGNSLWEIGKMVMDRPDLITHPLIDEDRIDAALGDVFEQIEGNFERLILKMEPEAAWEQIPAQLIGKLICLMMLAACTEHRVLLTVYVYELSERLPVKTAGLNYTTAIMSLAYSLGGVDQWRDLEEKQQVLNQMYQACLIINGGPDINGATPIFQWMAFWLDLVGLEKKITAQQVWDLAWDSFGDDK
jgi:tetratricopeptide (TPR) repeat protein